MHPHPVAFVEQWALQSRSRQQNSGALLEIIFLYMFSIGIYLSYVKRSFLLVVWCLHFGRLPPEWFPLLTVSDWSSARQLAGGQLAEELVAWHSKHPVLKKTQRKPQRKQQENPRKPTENSRKPKEKTKETARKSQKTQRSRKPKEFTLEGSLDTPN